MEDVKLLSKKPKYAYFTSILFLSFIVLGTIILYLYNNYLVSSINDKLENIRIVESSIKEVENDKNIQIYSLLETNKTVLSSYESINHVSDFINHLNLLKSKYDINFYGFELSNWVLKSEVTTISDNNWIAFLKARNFIKKYRSDNDAIFDLWFVNDFLGSDEIKFNVNFKIK